MRSIAVAVALLSLAACDRSPTAPANRLLVTAYATPDTIRAGEPLNVIIAITNVSNTPQSYESNFCGPAYHVFNATGAPLDTTGCFTGYSAPRTLAPGAQDVYTSVWTTTTGPTAGPLPAGAYTIRGTLTGDGVENYAYTVRLTP